MRESNSNRERERQESHPKIKLSERPELVILFPLLSYYVLKLGSVFLLILKIRIK